MWVSIILAIIIALASYTFGIIVGLKLSNVLRLVEDPPNKDNPENTIKLESPDKIMYVYNPSTSNMSYDGVDISSEMNQSLKAQYMQKIQAAVISQQLDLTKNPSAIFHSLNKFNSYINNPFVSINQLENLLEMLNQAELFEWSKLVSDKIKQLQNE